MRSSRGVSHVLALLWVFICAANAKKLTPISLATSRVNDAVLFLSEVNPNDLDPNCREQLQTLQLGLLRSVESLEAGEREDALAELSVVESSLDSCLLSMKKLQSPEAFKARASLRRAGRSVSNADQLIQIARQFKKGIVSSEDLNWHQAENEPTFQSALPKPQPQVPSTPSNEKVFSTMPVSGTGFVPNSEKHHSPSLYSSTGTPKFMTAEPGNVQQNQDTYGNPSRNTGPPKFSTDAGTGFVPNSEKHHSPSLYSSTGTPKFMTGEPGNVQQNQDPYGNPSRNTGPPKFSTNAESKTKTEQKAYPESISTYSSGAAPAIIAQQAGEPLTSILIDHCSNHAKVKKNSVTMRLDKACGSKFHSTDKYSSGIFSAWIRAPIKASGVSSSFYINSNDNAPDAISFDFHGNQPKRISTCYTVHGRSDKNIQTFAVSFDTSVKFHKYTIKWDSESIMWLVDGVLFRTVAKTRELPYPTKSGALYGVIWDATHSGIAGTIDWHNSPFTVYYDDIYVSTPLVAGTWRLPPQAEVLTEHVPTPMRPLVVDYCGDNVEVTDTDVFLRYNDGKCGGRVRSISRYLEGTFTTRVKCALGDSSGLVSSFYLSSFEGSTDRDEISFDWLGFNKHVVQTNFVVNGRGGNDEVIDLSFDCSQGFHKYSIRYSKQHIQWIVDDRVLRTVTFAQQSILAGTPYPVKPMYVYSSVWNGSHVNSGKWAGAWHGSGMPYTATFSDITIKSSY